MTNPRFFTRQHFPVLAGMGGLPDYTPTDIAQVVLPPCHPLIEEQGYDVQQVYSSLREALSLTAEDLREAQLKIKKNFDFEIREIEEALGFPSWEEYAKAQRGGKCEQVSSHWLDIFPFPLWDGLEIKSHGIYFGSKSLTPSRKEERLRDFQPAAKFSPELMEEYGMTLREDGWIQHEHGLYQHNLSRVDRLFAKNVAIVVNNAVVEKKYGGK